MVEQSPTTDKKRRTAFIDHESYFIGNGFVDLTFLLLYGTDLREYDQNPNLFMDCFEFYYSCLLRHGLDPWTLGFRPSSECKVRL